jgi:DNA polymerase III subunit delta
MPPTQLRPEALDAHLERHLAPLYVIHGDEPLTSLEAADAIRAAARRAGCEDRELFVVEPHFRWDGFVAANANLGLFGSRKLVDLRIPSGKPGVEGAAVLARYAENPNPDNITLITLPRLDRATQSSAWFTALARAGVTIAVPAIDRAALPAWIASRLARNGQRAGKETLAFLAERCEGNLLAAKQEIEKLALLLPDGPLDQDAVLDAVADVARYDIFELSEAWLAGDAARMLRIVSMLRESAEPVTLVIWQLSEDLHALAAVHESMQRGMALAAALRGVRVWGKRQSALERAARRMAPAQTEPLLRALAGLDALAKGIGAGNPWDALTSTALALCGKRVPALA